MPSVLVEAGLGIWQANEEADAQEEAQTRSMIAQQKQQEKMLEAQKKSAREAQARTPAQLKQREYSADSSSARLRGIQATMLASRKAQNSDAVGKTHLGE